MPCFFDFILWDTAMKLQAAQILARLGLGQSIAQVCLEASLSREQFDDFWQDQCRKRLAVKAGTCSHEGLNTGARIVRDQRGVPHIQADNDHDLFFAFGYAVAQDRLFQLDYLRRKALGTLAEILGPEALEQDVFYRTIGLGKIAHREVSTFTSEMWELTSAYCRGINAWMETTAGNWPIEFDLLDYQPTPWTIIDTLAIIGEFRWYLTGRFPVIAIPELVKRAVGDGPLYREFILGEADQESILQRGEYPTSPRWNAEGDTGGTLGGDAGGSNNWTLAGQRTTTGQSLLASDPHIPFYAVSIWHEVHLRGGSFNVAGVALAGMPAVMLGRNERVAWGITNNICSLRDLYQEKTDPAHPGCFLYDGRWEPSTERQEVLYVRTDTGLQQVRRTIRSSRNGPIVAAILPPEAQHTGPVSLRWLGTEPCGWLRALLGMNRARNCQELREASRPWSVPTFNLVSADVEGNIGFQTVGRIPLRKQRERGYRPGWDPAHQWQGFIPFDELPHLLNPSRGFVVTANNRLAPDDFPYPLAGCWAQGYRHARIREKIQGKPRWSSEDCQQLQLDTHSGRAAVCVPEVVRHLHGDADPRLRQAVARLADWDFRSNVDSVPALLFNAFFTHWCKAVTRERLPADQAGLTAALAGGIATRLLQGDAHGWFAKTPRSQAIRSAFVAMLDDLTARLGPDINGWTWGRVHVLQQKHFLSGRGDLGHLLDLSGLPVCGDGTTVCSATPDANFQAYLGAGYRMVADMTDPLAGLFSVEVAGVSGQPGSRHYADQMEPWNAGRLFYLPLQGELKGNLLTLTAKKQS
jgi:penicillin G amidase